MPNQSTGRCPRPRLDSALLVLLALAACQPPGAASSADCGPQPAARPSAVQPPAAACGEPEVLAVIDGTPIHASEIEPGIAFRLYQIEADRYALLARETDEIIERRLLAGEAARRKLTVEALIEAEVQSRLEPVTDADVDAYLAENPRDAARGPAIRPRIAAFLAERRAIERRLALVQRLREQADVQVLLRAPERPRTRIDIQDAPARGPADAPVTLVHFASFTSAESARSAGELRQIADAYPDRIRWVHRHYLEVYDEVGLRAAELSLAAQDAGRFWDFHDLAFARGGALTGHDLAELAARLHLPEPPADVFARVKQHLDIAVKAGVERLPVVFVNGRYFSGTFSYDKLRALIAEELEAPARPGTDP